MWWKQEGNKSLLVTIPLPSATSVYPQRDDISVVGWMTAFGFIQGETTHQDWRKRHERDFSQRLHQLVGTNCSSGAVESQKEKSIKNKKCFLASDQEKLLVATLQKDADVDTVEANVQLSCVFILVTHSCSVVKLLLCPFSIVKTSFVLYTQERDLKATEDRGFFKTSLPCTAALKEANEAFRILKKGRMFSPWETMWQTLEYSMQLCNPSWNSKDTKDSKDYLRY